jgi:hypothetical protein
VARARGASPVLLDYLWHGWIPARSITFLTGLAESLKSWSALYIAAALAAGHVPFPSPGWSADIGEPIRVLYISAENGIEEERRRVHLLAAGHSLPADLPLLVVDGTELRLSTPRGQRALATLLAAWTPTLIVLDPAIALAGVTNENDNTEVRRFMQERLIPLRNQGFTFLVLAHPAKPPTHPGALLTDEHAIRGAIDWRNAAETILALRRAPELGPESITMRLTKTRRGRRVVSPFHFRLVDLEPPRTGAAFVVDGVLTEETGQARSAPELWRTVLRAIALLREAPRLLGDLQDALGGRKKGTARRATDVLRGLVPHPSGLHKGKKVPLVTEAKDGRSLRLTFIAHDWQDDVAGES